jgi:hypothetical protein
MSGFVTFVAVAVLGAVQGANPERPELGEVQVDALRKKNIFSPFRTKPFDPPKPPGGTTTTSTPAAVPAKPKPPMVTGIVYDEASKSFQVIIEDRNEEKFRQLTGPKFLKAGEEVLDVRIESVAKDKVVVVRGEAKKELTAGDPLWEPEGSTSVAAPSTTTSPAVESKPADPAVTNSVLEELKKKNKKKDRSYDEP